MSSSRVANRQSAVNRDAASEPTTLQGLAAWADNHVAKMRQVGADRVTFPKYERIPSNHPQRYNERRTGNDQLRAAKEADYEAIRQRLLAFRLRYE